MHRNAGPQLTRSSSLPNTQMIAQTIQRRMTQPILASLLEQRSMTLAITGAVVVHGGLTWLGLPGWQCPIRQYLGVPCLGCGLSRAMLALLGGDWSTALRYHAFAPLFLAALLLIALTACLPQQARQQVSRWVAQVERRTGLTGLLLVGLVFYWLVRLLFFYDSFVGLIMG